MSHHWAGKANQLFVAVSIVIFAWIALFSAFGSADAQYGTEQVENTNTGLFLTLVGSSTNDKYEAQVRWYHDDIGSANSFSVSMLDPNQPEPRDLMAVTYDIRIYKGDEYLLPVQQVIDGDGENSYNFIFPEQGSYTLTISSIDGSSEKIEIPMQVTPEFPMLFGALMTLAGSIVGIVVLGRNEASKA